MSVELQYCKRLCIAILLVAAPYAYGQGAETNAFFTDPLGTSPPVLGVGTVLPGDTEPVPCPAAVDLTKPLALNEAVDVALCNNPQVQAAWAEIKIQAAAKGEALAAYLPTLSGSVSRLNDQTRYPGTNIGTTNLKSSTVYGALSWRIFDFGARAANSEAANRSLQAALAGHDATVQKALLSVTQSYFDAQAALAAWEAKENDRAIAQRILDASKRRELRGVGSESDTLQASAALAKAALDRNRAFGTYRKSLSMLVYSMGADPGAQLTLADDLADHSKESVQELASWLEQARLHHPGIESARAQLAAARQKVEAARSEGLPTVDFTGNYYQNGRPNQGLTPANTRETTLGIALNIPIFDGFSHTYKVEGALAQAEQREADLRDTEHQILMEVVKTYADAKTALADLSASESFLVAAEKSLETVQRKFDKGAADILEVLNAQTTLSDARRERILCLSEWRSARLRLLASSGLLGRQATRP